MRCFRDLFVVCSRSRRNVTQAAKRVVRKFAVCQWFVINFVCVRVFVTPADHHVGQQHFLHVQR